MAEFLTVKQAATRTGKSPSSIRRIIHPIIKDDAHKDRDQIKPSVEEAQDLRMKGATFAWQLSDDLLRREMPDDGPLEKGSAGSSLKASGSAEAELLAMLRQELEIKNGQIAKQAEIIAKQMDFVQGVGERLKESNILLARFQEQQLGLGDGRGTKPVEQTKPTRAAAEKGSASAQKRKVKPGFFGLPDWLTKLTKKR